MAYLIRAGEPIGLEVHRALAEQIARARQLLGDWRLDPRENVHQARQSFKRIRALLRLIRPGARYVYRVENLAFGDLGRGLAYARDTEAVVEALGLLEPRVSGPLARESLQMLRRGLQQRANRERDCGIHDLPGRIDQALAMLEKAAGRLDDMPLERLRRKHLRRGVERGCRRCLARFEAAESSGAPEDLHAWRRDVKSTYHQTRLMAELMPRWARAAGPGLGTLAETLGHHQDLSVLDRLLRSQADELNIDVHLRSIRNALRDAQAELATSALQAGASLFRREALRPDSVVELTRPA